MRPRCSAPVGGLLLLPLLALAGACGPSQQPPPARPGDGGPDALVARPVPGDRVVINGLPLPREKVVVFLHIGHSNMAGRTDSPPELRPFNFDTHPQLWAYHERHIWVPAREPLSGDFLTRGRAGPGMSILRTALAMAPDAYIVSIGHGQDGSRGGRCAAFRRGGLLWDTVMAPARELKGKVIFGGIFSMLVLMEVFGDRTTLQISHQCYEGLAADMRTELGDPDIPFLMSDWEMGATGRFRPTTPEATLAREQLQVAQQNIPRSLIIPTDRLPMSDNHHFDLTGYKLWAERAFDLMKQAGWTPWSTTP
jgi:hypothetical protein